MVSEREVEGDLSLDDVLILILLEDGFGAQVFVCNARLYAEVLILILLEDGFGASMDIPKRVSASSLNPYFVGRWFRSG